MVQNPVIWTRIDETSLRKYTETWQYSGWLSSVGHVRPGKHFYRHNRTFNPIIPLLDLQDYA